MTSAGSKANAILGIIYMFYLLNVTAGAKTIAISWSSPSTRVVGGCVSFTGVHQTTPIGTFVSASGTSGGATVNASSVEGDMVIDTVVGVSMVPPDVTATVGAGQTQRWNTGFNLGAGASLVGAGSTEPGAATVTMSWTINNSMYWAIGALPVKAAGAAAGRTNRVWVIGGG